jgi:omega-6 fatty acid desaturase (delta-12 desaturase)
VVSIQQIRQQKRDIILRHSKPENFKGLTQVLTTLGPMALLWWAVTQSVDLSYWLVAAETLLLCLFSIRVLVLMHECGHFSMFRTRELNRAFGFLFGVVAGMPQYVWSQHHDFHHSNNGNWEKYRGPLTSPSVEEYEAMTEGQRRMYRYARNFVFAPFGGFVYLIFNPRFTWLKGSIQFVIHVLRAKIARPSESFAAHAESFKPRYWQSRAEYRHMTLNNLVLICAWCGMCLAVGPALFFSVYVVSVSLAGGIGIALFTLQHNFEHAYATDSERWDYDTGAIEGSSFLVLPGWLNWFTANIGYHHIHHLSAKIPNYCLVACHDEYAHLFTGVRRLRLSQMIQSLKCLLWDARAQRIISFAEHRLQVEQRAMTKPA